MLVVSLCSSESGTKEMFLTLSNIKWKKTSCVGARSNSRKMYLFSIVFRGICKYLKAKCAKNVEVEKSSALNNFVFSSMLRK